jgi:hypothetical protein
MTSPPAYTFSYTGNIVTWTVPVTGYYQILTYGGEGGKGGGLGAEIGGDFQLQADQILTILVGNMGDPTVRPSSLGFGFPGGAGGGGTFVVVGQNTPLVVAGGGGGNSLVQHSPQGAKFNASPKRFQDGSVLTSGRNGFGSTGGTNGSGGGSPNTWVSGAGGGGLLTNGQKVTHINTGKPGFSFLNGGEGGLNPDFRPASDLRSGDGAGAFGGGGGAAAGGGGGGGYSGGGGGVSGGSGGGGGSYDAGANQLLIAGENAGAGLVTITQLGSTSTAVASQATTTVLNTDISFNIASGSQLVDARGADTISAGTGSDTITTGSQGVVATAGAGALNFVAGTGAATVTGGSGDALLYGSTGKAATFFSAGTGNETLVGGYGPSVLIGGENTVEITAGSGLATLVGGYGRTVINGAEGSGAELISAGPGSSLIHLNDAADTVLGGSGASTISAGDGKEVYGFINGHGGGNETVIGFNDNDILAFAGYGYSGQNTPYETLTSVGDLMTLSDNTTILFVNYDEKIF